ncbi:MAG: 3'(2'),5'-bisphosphate nucleotidase [Denitrovibrio sp.]|nr:MAG: 3'(2'),5'-bisphosphate nucleotidase [Denitrovibrio sp.]
MQYDQKLLDEVIDIAVQAGSEIIEIYKKDFSIEYKDDKSPLTEADKHSNDVICTGLQRLDRQYPILSEENKAVEYAERKNWDCFWLVDPIDGTKEFIKKNGEFTVNIALIENGSPVMGVVYAPALETLYYGMKGHGAFRKTSSKLETLPVIENDPAESKIIRVVASRSHLNEETSNFIDNIAKQYPNCEIEKVSKGSSLKLCMVAEGSADVYPRVAPTMEWDTAAAQGVVEAAGKHIYNFETFPSDNVKFNLEIITCKITYNKENLLNPFFIVL